MLYECKMLYESWDASYPLTESQKDFFVALHEGCRMRGGPQQQKTPQLAVACPSPSPRSPTGSETQAKATTRGPLETTQQFLTWFAEIERDMARGDEDDYCEYSALVESYCHSTTHVLKNLDQTTDQVEALRRNNALVSEKTRGLQAACEKLLDEQVPCRLTPFAVSNVFCRNAQWTWLQTWNSSFSTSTPSK